MSELNTPYTPPTYEEQYRHFHPSKIPEDRLAVIRDQIAKEGVYVGEIALNSRLTGAVEVIEPTHAGELLKIMPNVIDLPLNHPARRGHAHRVRLVQSSPVRPLPNPVRPVIAERHRMPTASLEEVQAVGNQAENIVRTQGQAGERTPHIRSYKALGVPRSVVPEAAQESLGFRDEQIDCEVVTDSRDGKTTIVFQQIYVPSRLPGYYKDSVTYDLSGNGERVTKATIMDVHALMEFPNPDHHSGSAPIEQPEAQQLARLLSSFESTK